MRFPALFLDRDGTLIKEKGYLSEPKDLELLPGVIEGLKKVSKAGFKLVVVSNQSGVARGFFPESKVLEINLYLEKLLLENGVELDKIYYCPHHPRAEVAEYRGVCSCRKPQPGLILRAEKELSLVLTASFILGDKISDIEMGKALGISSVFLLTGVKSRYEQEPPVFLLPDFAARNFSAAIEWIIKQK